MSSPTRVAVALGLFACSACGGQKPSAAPPPAPATSAASSSSHDADCKSLVAHIDRIERESVKANEDERGDLAVRAAMQVAEQGAAELDALSLPDATAHRLAGDYASHLRAKRTLMAELLPALERYSNAVLAAKQTEAATDADLADCKQQKKLSKACEAKVAAATDKAAKAGIAVGTAHAEVRAMLENPALKERDTRLSTRDKELAEQLHQQCAGPSPAPAP